MKILKVLWILVFISCGSENNRSKQSEINDNLTSQKKKLVNKDSKEISDFEIACPLNGVSGKLDRSTFVTSLYDPAVAGQGGYANTRYIDQVNNVSVDLNSSGNASHNSGWKSHAVMYIRNSDMDLKLKTIENQFLVHAFEVNNQVELKKVFVSLTCVFEAKSSQYVNRVTLGHVFQKQMILGASLVEAQVFDSVDAKDTYIAMVKNKFNDQCQIINDEDFKGLRCTEDPTI
jgi:uncharacterized protein YlbG (UPF0298 family)